MVIWWHEIQKLQTKIESSGCKIGYNNWGDSKHFSSRQK